MAVYVLIDGIWYKQPDNEARRQKIEALIWNGKLPLKNVLIDPSSDQIASMTIQATT